MSERFTNTFFTANRAKLREVCNPATIVVTANGLLQRAGDNPYPFQQDSNFWYLTGINEQDVILVMDDTEEYLIVPGRSASRETFEGVVDSAALTHVSGIEQVLDDEKGWAKLIASLKQSHKVATPHALPNYVEHYGMYANPARDRLTERIDDQAQGTELVDIRKDLARLRAIKQPLELASLQQAIDITIDSLQLLTEPKRFAEYKHEYEFEADLSREFRFRGALGHAFAPIVAGGQRACTLHNIANSEPLEADSLVVIDVGAEVNHYAADITRVKVYGTPTQRQQDVYAAVLDVQKYALTLLKPGAMLKEYEQAVETYMGTALQTLGLIKLKPGKDAGLNHDAIRSYFPHATSHFLGLDVHDVGDYERPLEANMVLTCEPGIYIAEEGIGVRIEDDVLITKDGNRVLSDRLSKSLR